MSCQPAILETLPNSVQRRKYWRRQGIEVLLPTTTTQSIPQENVNIADQLERLAKLKEQGILTEEEFASQKKKLLGL